MASKVTDDQIVALKTVGISNREIIQQSHVRRKTELNVWKRYTKNATAASKPILGRKRSICTKPIVQLTMKRVERNPRRSVRKTESLLGISRSSMHRIYKNDLRLTVYKNNPESYFQHLPSRNDMAETKECWRRCSSPLTMSSSGRTGKSSQCRQCRQSIFESDGLNPNQV